MPKSLNLKTLPFVLMLKRLTPRKFLELMKPNFFLKSSLVTRKEKFKFFKIKNYRCIKFVWSEVFIKKL